MGHFDQLEQALARYLEPQQIDIIREAYLFAYDAHEGQTRMSGKPYITHPVAAAMILADMRMDQQTIMATLLHDVLEDTKISKQELADRFGDEVAELVDGVSKLTQIEFSNRAEAQAENFRKMVLAMVRDIRVILVKLADRLHNMRTIGAVSAEKRRRIGLETLEIYAPIANRLGMHALYVELEDLGFKARYPMRARIVENAVRKARGNRKEILNEIEATLTKALRDSGIEAITLFGRTKHLYSIYKKMRNKTGSFAEIMDVYGFRIIIDHIDTCYRVLGAVHRVYKPVPEHFKDYIAIPKANGYQSLHTALFGPYGVPIEVQIRTEDMEKLAENGIASHWIYKTSELDEDEQQLRARAWIKSLLEMQQSTGSSLEFIESVKIDLFPDEVYVFTPEGDIMELPRGATPVDFAYMVHSDIGNSCVAARVDRRLAPLSLPLVNGQKVEIITAPGAFPNPAWLNFVVTGKARSNIRHFLKTKRYSESVTFGKRLLIQAFNDLDEDMGKLNDAAFEPLLQRHQFSSFDDLCEAIGFGNLLAQVVARQVLAKPAEEDDESHPPLDKSKYPLVIKGTEGLVISFADCCRPIPGDTIVGVLQPGSGIMVHQEPCPQVSHLRERPDRLVNMQWEEEVEGDFLVDIIIEVFNQRGVLALMASAISDAEANIDNISVDTRDGHHHLVHFTINVRDRNHLARVIRRLKVLRMVSRVQRTKAFEL